MLRGESIKGQLSGTIPSTMEGQKADSSAIIDASHLNISDLGQFKMGERGGNQWKMPGRDNKKTSNE